MDGRGRVFDNIFTERLWRSDPKLFRDVGFLRLHAKGTEHCGIVYAHQRTPIGDVIRGLMLLHQVLDYNDMQDHIEFL